MVVGVSRTSLEIRTMRDEELPLVHDLVLDAFEVYPVPMRPTQAQLAAMVERRGIEWSASFGAFHEGRLIGVTLTAIDEWPTDHIGAYAVLAGVRRGWQGRGVLTGLFEWLNLALDRRDVTQMQLEVLIDNPRARRAYERLGFDTERHLFCFELPRLTRPQRFTEQLSFEIFEGERSVAAVEAERGHIWTEFWSITPAWTSSTWTVRRTDSRIVFEARWDEEVCGYAVLEPEHAELLQIAVAPEHRRKGIATELIRAAQRLIRGPALRILNVDGGDNGVTIACLRRLGATMTAVQLEMVLHRLS